MRPLARFTAVLILPFALSSCADTLPAGPAPSEAALRVAHGRLMFNQECATCHASSDGFDLAFFNFTDTTIIRRALGHVDRGTAEAIVAYIRSLEADRRNRELRLFQPGGRVLPGDVSFAVTLFGSDALPPDLSTDALRALDPRQIAVAVPLPLWSVEGSNVDWMPEHQPPRYIFDDQGGRAGTALAAYRSSGTKANLVRVVNALRSAERRLANPSAPCLLDSLDRVSFGECFEIRRWTAVLGGQHLFRNGQVDRLDRSVHDSWWEVGNVARKSIAARTPLPNAERVWAEWMYLGWIFEPPSFASTYTGNGLLRLGLARHATFVALRSEVSRPRGSVAPYHDAESAARFAPGHWAYAAVRVGLTHLLERQRAGDVPPADMLADARMRVENALVMANRKVPVGQRPEIQQLAAAVLAGIP